MYRIGEFSHLCETTIKTLRHYDKIDLLKPSKIDEYTGYRYYEDNQIKTLETIKNLQYTGFSLKEIKELLNEKNQEKLNKQIEKIKSENSKKIMILQKMKNNMEKQKVELITNPNFLIGGKFKTVKSRTKLDEIITNLKEKYPNQNIIIENYEKGFKKDNINCLIGVIIKDNIKDNPKLLSTYVKKNIVILNNKQVKTVLHTTVTETIQEAYKEIIEFANKNKIQIRGNFQEVYTKNNIDIYVEAYDLQVENEDELNYRKKLKDNIKNIHPKEFIGKWKLQGEITELPNNFNPNKKHYYPDTKYEILELNEDGSTNFKNIIWKDKYLIIKENETTFYSHLSTPKRKFLKTYMKVLINQKESNSRPYEFYYKKIK